MRIPYTVAVVLGLLPAVLGIFGFIVYPWGLLATILGVLVTVIFSVCTVRGHYAERDAFRKKIGKEALGILNIIISDSTDNHISCSVWSGNNEGFKAEVLGDGDYKAWDKFYDTVDTRNDYFGSRRGFSFPDLEKLSYLCFESFFKAYDEISWVRDVIPQERITDLLTRAKGSAETCGFARHRTSRLV